MGIIAGQIIGGLKEAQQWQNQQDLMEDQYYYNERTAKNNQQRNKDMWDYTNYENQKKHIENAGLNASLLYGMSGGGGSSAAGAQAQGITQPQDRSVEMGIRGQEMGLQLENLKSQIELNKSQANKNNAEADKTAGVDTEAVKITTEMNKRITALQDTVEKVLNSQEQLNAANYFKVQAEERRMWEQLRSDIVKADIDEKTKDEQINAAGLANWNSMLKGIETISKTKLNEQEISKLKNDMAVAWANVALGEKSVSNEADKIANEVLLKNRDLTRKEEELLKDWIYEGVS